jgi:hypothetical protein
LTANAARKPRKSQTLSLVPESTRSKVPCCRPNTTIAASMSSDPAIV